MYIYVVAFIAKVREVDPKKKHGTKVLSSSCAHVIQSADFSSCAGGRKRWSSLQLFSSRNMEITFTAKNKKVMVKCKQLLGKKRLHYVTNTTSALYNHLHRQHANTKLAKSQSDDKAERS